MKHLILVLVVVASAFGGWAAAQARNREHDARALAAKHAEARRIADIIASADRAIVRHEGPSHREELTIGDASWILRASNAVAAATIDEKVHCLCTGWRTVHFQRNGGEIITVAAIHGNALRIHWDGGGGDFPIAETEWKSVKNALEPPPSVASGTRPST